MEKILNTGELEDDTQEAKPSETPAPASEPETDETPEPVEGEQKEGLETKEAKPGKTWTDADFTVEVSKRAQAMKDKELLPVYKERTTLKDRVSELESQLVDREIDRDLDTIFKGDTDEYGEEQANKRKTALTKFADNWKEYQAKSHIHAKLDEIAVNIGTREKTVNIREALLDWRDKGFTFDVNEVRGKLEEASDPKTFEVVKNAITMELKAKSTKKAFRPDPGRSAGGGGPSLKNLTPDQLIERGLKLQRGKK